MLSLIFAVVMIFNVLPTVNVFAADIVKNGTCGKNLVWTLDSEGTLTVSGTGEMDDWGYDGAPWCDSHNSIKSVILEDGVTNIGNYAFYSCTGLTSVTISNSVMSIGDSAFIMCYDLTSVMIPDSVTSIGDNAFSVCSSLTSITIPDSVTIIGNSAFSFCYNLTSVTIGNSVTSIGWYAFDGCTSLTSVTIGNSVTSIGGYAFDDCIGLTSVIIPDGVTIIDDCAFYGCTGLTSVTIPDSVTIIDDAAFFGCIGLTSITIPDSVTNIGGSAFARCAGLTSVTIPDSVTSIGRSAFYGCTSLTDIDANENNNDYSSVDGVLFNKDKTELVAYPAGKTGDSYVIPNSVTSIGYGAFYTCTGLTDIAIPDSVKSVDDSAFARCIGLTGITIPDSVTYIGNSAFGSCTSLTDITVNENNNEYSSLDGVLFNKSKTELVAYPAGKTEDNYAIPNGVMSIGHSAFEGCIGLTGAAIPNSVTKISIGAFYSCTNLESIKIPRSVTDIGESAFGYYYDYAGNYYSKKQNFIIYGYNESVAEEYANDNDFEFLPACQHSSSSHTEQDEVPATCKENGYTAGIYCNECEEWISGHELIKSHHTDNNDDEICDICSKETELSIKVRETKNIEVVAGEITYIRFVPEVSGKYTLKSHSEDDTCGYLFGEDKENELASNDDGDDDSNFSVSYYLEAGRKYYWGAKYYSSNKSGSFDVSLTKSETAGTFGEKLTWTFDDNGTLNISGTGKMTDWDDSDDVPWYDYKDLIKTVIIEDGITSIGDYAFSFCYGLTNIMISNSVTSIGGYAFGWCNDLTSVMLPNGVTSIGGSAFRGCISLTSIAIPGSVTSIGRYVFKDCTGLTNITVDENSNDYSSMSGVLFNKDKTELIVYPAGKTDSSYVIPNAVTSIDDEAFSRCGLASVKISDSVMSIGRYAFYRCPNLASIVIPSSVTEICEYAFGYDSYDDESEKIDNFIIYGYNGTAAEEYATENGFEFKTACQHSLSSHTEQAEIPATCTGNGYTAGVYCNECEEWISGHKLIKAHHTDNDNDGICDVCGKDAELSIKVGETKNIEIVAGEITYIKFVPEVSGIYTLKSHSEDDTYGYLFGEDKENELASNDDGDEGNNFSVSYNLEAGKKYYWGAKYYSSEKSGSFDVSLTKSESGDDGNNGTCGENLTWALDSNGTLTISGTGNMAGWETDHAPWYDNRDSIKTVIIEDGVTSIGANAFFDCKGLSSVTIPNGVTSISSWAFGDCTALASITIPDSVTIIDYQAFFDCTGLTSVTIGNSVTSIGWSTFYGCTGLTSIIIPDSVTEIDHFAFGDCTGLTSITIPGSVTSVYGSAFYGCSGLTDIAVNENNNDYSSVAGVLFDRDKTELIAYPAGKADTSYIIPDSVTSIGELAFYRCTDLKRIIIPSSVTSIGDSAFHGCVGLTSITLPDSVTSIGEYVFYGCTGLTGITIPDSVTSIGCSAFEDCIGLTSITIPDSVTGIDRKAFLGCAGLTSVTLGSNVTNIGEYAFYGCTDLTSITIPKSVTNIGEIAFGYYYDNDAYDYGTVHNFKIYGFKNTAAEEYATENGFEFVSLGDIHAHSYEETVEQAATCTVDGVMRYTCSCGDSYTAAILAPGHTSVKLDAVLPTCTTDGKTEGEKCSVCGEILAAQKNIKATGHKPVTTKAVAATCTKNGKTEEIKCSVCGVVIKAASVIKPTGHKYSTTTTKATLAKDGSTVTKCKVCQAVKSRTAIPKVSSISLSKTAFTYNGKAQRPSVVVKDRTGKILKNGTDYTVKYSSGCKNVGQYSVTITFKGKYTGTKTLTFKIVPKGTSISKLTAGKKQFTAKWSAQTAQTTGYELQYSTSSSMSGAKTVTVGKNKTTSAKVKKLKGKKKYYVRVRTYKIVKINGKSVKLYSSWSKVKSVKTK